MTTVTFRISGYDLPGARCVGLPGIAKPVYDNVHVGVQHKREVVSLVRGDAAEARWDLDVDIVPGRDGRLDFRGPWVQGKLGDRFLYLTRGGRIAGGCLATFRRAKLMLAVIDEGLLHEAIASGATLEGRLPLTDAKGGPRCAAVRPPDIRWSLLSE